MTPPLSIGIDVNPHIKPVRQLFGTIFTIFLILCTLRVIFVHLFVTINVPYMNVAISRGIAAIGASFYLFFFIRMLQLPEFIAGNPKFKTFLAPLANLSLNFLRIFIGILYKNSPEAGYDPQSEFLGEILVFLAILLVYGQRDDMKHCCLCFKPWVSIPCDLTVDKFTDEAHASQYPTVPFTYPGYNNNTPKI